MLFALLSLEDVLYDEGCWFLQSSLPDFTVSPLNAEQSLPPLRSLPKDGQISVKLVYRPPNTSDSVLCYDFPLLDFKIDQKNVIKVVQIVVNLTIP